jgi:hypothetical protein
VTPMVKMPIKKPAQREVHQYDFTAVKLRISHKYSKADNNGDAILANII